MKNKKAESFGSLLGVAPGNVEVYSSDYNSASNENYPTRGSFRSYHDGVYMGYKWQCVEFARRWMYINKGYIFDDVAMAYDIFELRNVRDTKSNQLLSLNAFANGSKQHPVPGSLLIWQEGGEFKDTGHVAIITEVGDTYLRVAEQNVVFEQWLDGRDYARELKAKIGEDDDYWVSCTYVDGEILGWMIQTDDDTYAEPRHETNPELMQVKSRHAQLDESELASNKKSWLNLAKDDEAAYVEVMGGHCLTLEKSEQTRYFVLSESAKEALEHATNELHGLFMHATDYVLENEHLLEKFNLPKSLWFKIRQSWDNRLNQLITSRFDFALTEKGLKVYEYNCDSASCYMEAGKVQGKWAEHYDVEDGDDAGQDLFDKLVTAWKNSKAKGLVHILRDDEGEEKYHALFIQETLRAAGLKSKIIIGLHGLHADKKGNIKDADGAFVKWVWKTWSWETALDQIRQESEADADESYEPGLHPERQLRLSDVLLQKDIMVFEPLWSLIPSNKAILPIISSLFPNHPLLLNSAFELNDELTNNGYVVKPIVGRCGANISLFDESDNLLESTGGKFSERDVMYQQLFPLPNVDGFYTQVCTFTAAGLYAGACVRVDKSMVIKSESDCMPLRFIEDNHFEKDD